MDKQININKYPKTEKYICLYFHAHQPWRISNYSIFDLGTDKDYFLGPTEQTNEYLINRVVDRGYRPANQLMLDLIQNSGLKVSYSLTGTLLEQLQTHAPDVIDQYRQMLATGKAELIAETYYHSLSFFYSLPEFIRQVTLHRDKLKELFDFKPTVFRNTELTYRNDVGELARQLGFKAIYAEGWDPVLDWRSPNFLYHGKAVDLDERTQKLADKYKVGRALKNISLLLKNYRRSDDIAFRFQLKGWEGYPVTAEKYAQWIKQEPGHVINLCMDYETIGEHHRVESGIFEFYKALPEELAKVGVEFILPSEAIDMHSADEELDFPDIVSWADQERDLSAWMGNTIQQKALESIYQLESDVEARLASYTTKEERDELLAVWGKLQTSDHFYYMSTKYWSDGDVHKYFSPYGSPYEGYINFMNVLRDFRNKWLG